MPSTFSKPKRVLLKNITFTGFPSQAPQWRNGWNETAAQSFCDSAINGDSLAVLCLDVGGVDITETISQCVSDIYVSTNIA